MDTQYARQQMVEQQIRVWGVRDRRLLDLFEQLSRDIFVPTGHRELAFADAELPIGHGERMMRPSVEGRLLQALDVLPDDDVLEIGTGSGFLTACLSRLGTSVVSVDIHDDFGTAAAGKLESQGIDNVTLATLDACRELPEGRFDVIAVTGSLPEIDQRMLEALKPGGRLFAVVGEDPVMDARLYRRSSDDAWETTSLFETSLKALQNVRVPSRFSF